MAARLTTEILRKTRRPPVQAVRHSQGLSRMEAGPALDEPSMTRKSILWRFAIVTENLDRLVPIDHKSIGLPYGTHREQKRERARERERERERATASDGADSVSPKTRERYRQLAEQQLIPHFGTVLLQKLRPARVEEWHAKLLRSGGKGGRPLSARTVGHAHRVLHRALARA